MDLDKFAMAQQSNEVHRLLITLSIQLCVLHDGRDAARCAGPSASAETCFSIQFFDLHRFIRLDRLRPYTSGVKCTE